MKKDNVITMTHFSLNMEGTLLASVIKSLPVKQQVIIVQEIIEIFYLNKYNFSKSKGESAVDEIKELIKLIRKENKTSKEKSVDYS